MHHPSHLPIVMKKLTEAEMARAAENIPRAARTDSQRRSPRFLPVPRASAKGPTTRPAA